MHLIKRTLYQTLVLSGFLLTVACSQQEGLDIPTSTSVNPAEAHPISAPDSSNTLTAAKAPVKLLLSGVAYNTDVTGTCSVSRNRDGNLVWKLTASNLTPEFSGLMMINDDINALDTFIFVADSRGNATSGRRLISPSPASGTMIVCVVFEGGNAVASTGFFPAR